MAASGSAGLTLIGAATTVPLVDGRECRYGCPSRLTNDAYEGARAAMRDFVGGRPDDVVFLAPADLTRDNDDQPPRG
ncbi:hypothetical protein [Micromonospora sp. NPDC005220]|uniref:hypothetical protein n=1 Tax=Micromonospora sp. NPDC005220 TaxID=3155589 RepID=UPI0033BBEF31